MTSSTESPSLFSQTKQDAPLAHELKPLTLNDYIGQEHLLQKDKPIYKLIQNNRLVSLLFWGPPGCGKTALARLITLSSQATCLTLNAVSANMADIKHLLATAKSHQETGLKTCVFIDEIHRFNKTQQDALLPAVEKGLITLLGATTENPYFSVIPSLLSRLIVFELQPLTMAQLETLTHKALQHYQKPISYLSSEVIDRICHLACGDARKLLNTIEIIYSVFRDDPIIQLSHLEQLSLSIGTPHDKESHYDLISAYIKSLRGSDPNASLYWVGRLLKNGEDPRFIARRLIIFASEDIGNADPSAFPMATALLTASQHIGMPEIRINIAQVTTYFAAAPKSNRSYEAINKVFSTIDEGTLYPVPEYLKNKPKKPLNKAPSESYDYPHQHPQAISSQQYLPKAHTYYQPSEHGKEVEIAKRLRTISDLKH